MAKTIRTWESLLEGKTYTAKQVRRMVYKAYKAAEGGHTESPRQSRIAVATARLEVLGVMFPKLFPEKMFKTTYRKLAKKRRAQALAWQQRRA